MELIFTYEYYDSHDFKEGEFSKDLKNKLFEFDNQLETIDGNIEDGSDWPVVIIELFKEIDWTSIFKIGTIPTVFFLGKKINENIDAWIEISKKAKKLFEKKQPTRIDEKAALLIVLQDISENNHDLKDLEISLRVHSYDGDFDINKKLKNRPNSLYVYDIRTTDSFLIYGLKSDGTVSFKHRYGKHRYEFLQDK
jgi:hypothetical protein